MRTFDCIRIFALGNNGGVFKGIISAAQRKTVRSRADEKMDGFLREVQQAAVRMPGETGPRVLKLRCINTDGEAAVRKMAHGVVRALKTAGAVLNGPPSLLSADGDITDQPVADCFDLRPDDSRFGVHAPPNVE